MQPTRQLAIVCSFVLLLLCVYVYVQVEVEVELYAQCSCVRANVIYCVLLWCDVMMCSSLRSHTHHFPFLYLIPSLPYLHLLIILYHTKSAQVKLMCQI